MNTEARGTHDLRNVNKYLSPPLKLSQTVGITAAEAGARYLFKYHRIIIFILLFFPVLRTLNQKI